MTQTLEGLIVNPVIIANKQIQVVLPGGLIIPFTAFITLLPQHLIILRMYDQDVQNNKEKNEERILKYFSQDFAIKKNLFFKKVLIRY